MNAWAFWSTLHYFWLVFQTWPLVVYLEGPSLYGAGIPFVVSLLILFWVFARNIARIHKRMTVKPIKNIKNTSHPLWIRFQQSAPDTRTLPAQIIVGFFLTNIVIGHYSGYWGNTGYHFLNTAIIFWPTLILLGARIPVLMVYPLTFLGMLFVDVYAAGQFGQWGTNFWFGVGGAGFHDGLFIGPVTALALSGLLSIAGWWLRHKQNRFFKDDPAFSSQ